MQDWNYLHTSDMEITIELSFNKYPAASTLPTHWMHNKEALYAFSELPTKLGVTGQIISSHSPITECSVKLETYENDGWKANSHEVQPNLQGRYWRMLTEGQHRLTATCGVSVSQKFEVIIPANQGELVQHDFSFGK